MPLAYPCHSTFSSICGLKVHPENKIWWTTQLQKRRSRATTDLAASTFLSVFCDCKAAKKHVLFPPQIMAIAWFLWFLKLFGWFLLYPTCYSEYIWAEVKQSVSAHHCACIRIDWLSDLNGSIHRYASTGTYRECWRRSITLLSFQISVVECSTAVLTAALDY